MFRTKCKLLARLARIQNAIDYPTNLFLQGSEHRLLANYSLALHREELFWFQKLMVNWIHLGDRNTRLY